MNSLGIAKDPSQTRVVVAMSGGVDSSVVAAMLHAQGYEVVGVTLQLYDQGAAAKRKGACCAGQDIYDAKQVADRAGFSHYVLDYEERFRKAVIDPFAESYAQGETPLPCAACNQTVKFRDLMAVAQDLQADVLATGHYVASKPLDNGHYGLFRAVDAERDQSYFLYGTTQAQLDYVRFPLGGMTKPEVRALAERYGLSVADKPDSQDICFVTSGKYSAIIEKLRPDAVRAGEIVHVDGRVLGQHDGIFRFTIGQRKGLGIAVGEPLYVVGLDVAGARVVVGPAEALAMREIFVRDVNWVGDQPLDSIGKEGMQVAVRVRSTRAPKEARLFAHEVGFRVVLAADEAGVAPGQACVVYNHDGAGARILGGGTIMRHEAAQTMIAAE